MSRDPLTGSSVRTALRGRSGTALVYRVKTGVVLTKIVHGFLQALGANSGVASHLNRDVFLTHSSQFTCDSMPIRNSDRVTVPHRISRNVCLSPFFISVLFTFVADCFAKLPSHCPTFLFGLRTTTELGK